MNVPNGALVCPHCRTDRSGKGRQERRFAQLDHERIMRERAERAERYQREGYTFSGYGKFGDGLITIGFSIFVVGATVVLWWLGNRIELVWISIGCVTPLLVAGLYWILTGNRR